jgi:hypothetical protein
MSLSDQTFDYENASVSDAEQQTMSSRLSHVGRRLYSCNWVKKKWVLPLPNWVKKKWIVINITVQ